MEKKSVLKYLLKDILFTNKVTKMSHSIHYENGHGLLSGVRRETVEQSTITVEGISLCKDQVGSWILRGFCTK